MIELLTASMPKVFMAVLVFLGLLGGVSFLRRTKDESTGRVHWRPLESVAVSIFIYFAAYLVSQLVLGLGVGVYTDMHKQAHGNVQSLLEGSVTVQFFASVLFYGLIMVFVYLFLKLRRTAWAAIGLVRPRFRDLGYALLGFVAYFAAYVIIIQIVHALVPGINLDQKQEIGFSTSSSGISLVLVFASLVILPPLVEEILSRGVLYSGLRTKLPLVTAAIITSVMFAAAHLQAGSGNALLWVAAVDTFTLSLVLVYLREKTGSLWPCITLHALKNSIAFLALFVFHLA